MLSNTKVQKLSQNTTNIHLKTLFNHFSYTKICFFNLQYIFLSQYNKSVISQTSYHIKVDWETHQIFLKYRDKLSCPMAGPTSMRRYFYPRRITKDSEHSNPVIRSFIASFDVDIISRELSRLFYLKLLLSGKRRQCIKKRVQLLNLCG